MIKGILIGLLIGVCAVYAVETIEELFEDQDMIKGPFFLIVTIAHIPILILLLIKQTKMPVMITLIGTAALFILYAITRTDLAMIFALDAGGIGHLGMVSKSLQIGVIASCLYLLKDMICNNKIIK